MPRRKEIAVVVDRSRDALNSGDLVDLHQDERFRVTETYRRLDARTLAAGDVLVIQSLGVAGYTAAELSAVRRFVERGGGLLLTTSAGAFEGRVAPVACQPVRNGGTGCKQPVPHFQQVADLFGIRFLSPAKALGKTTRDESLTLGFPRQDLVLSAVGPLAGFRLDDLVVRRAAPLDLPRGARVLLRHRRTGEPVAAAVRVGQGRVLAAGAIEFGRRWEAVGRSAVAWLAGTSRRRASRRLPDVLPPVPRSLRRDGFAARYHGVSLARVKAIIALIRQLSERFERTFGRKRPAVSIEVVPGAGCRSDWTWRSPRAALRIGADTCEPALVHHLAQELALRFLGYDGYMGLLRRSVGADSLFKHLALRAMEWLGYARESAERRALLEAWPGGTGDPRAVDLGRWYPEAGPSPALWMWRALEEQFGPALLQRFLRHQPKRLPWERFPPWDAVTEFDLLVYYLSLAARRSLFPWFAARGMTVHPIPLIAATEKAFPRLCLTAIRRRLHSETAPLSERYDAARALAGFTSGTRFSLNRQVRSLTTADEAKRLVSAMRLARLRDPRGTEALRAIAAHSGDAARAAIAAITLLHLGDTAAAGRLAELARTADARFQLDALAALEGLPERVPAPFTLTRERDEYLKHLARVDGYAVANVFSMLTTERWPAGISVPHLFVTWVHTAARWRRKGLSRALFVRTDGDRWNRAAATSALWTGTTNTAHTLYRSRGFIDLVESEEWSRSLEPLPAGTRVKGIRLRPAAPRDAGRMNDLFNEVYRDHLDVRRRRAAPPAGDALAVLAEKGQRPVGYLLGTLSDPDPGGPVVARLLEVCVRTDKDTEQVTAALAANWCALAARRGAGRASAWALPEAEAIRRGFQAAGFQSRKRGGVMMWRLNNLPLLLSHLRPLLERRLNDGKRRDWCGTIVIAGRKHRAALCIDPMTASRRSLAGKVAVLEALPPRPNITIQADDDTISRLVAGRQTATEAMLQLDLRVAPKPNEDVMALLECLFPRMSVYLG